jgi:hypothetical protein
MSCRSSSPATSTLHRRPLEPLREAGLADAWLLGGGDPAAVTLSSEHPEDRSDFHLVDERIDHVFVGSAARRPRRARVAVDRARLAGNEPVDGVYPSDHWAVVCDVTWTRGAAK